MESIAKIRRRHLVHGESVSAIARDLNLSRNTVRKYIHCQAEVFYKRNYQPCPQLGNYHSILEKWLETEYLLPKFQRRTAQRLFEGLQAEGYQGAYDSIQRFVKQWKSARSNSAAQAFVPLVFKAGEACQFDWSQEEVMIAGTVQTIKVAHFRLAYSRQMFVAAYPRETQEMVLDAHSRAFTFFGGVPLKMIYDNLKTVVDAIFVGKDRQFNRRFMSCANHYLFEPVACTPAAGWEKGQVENQVGNVREWLFTPRLSFESFETLNVWLATRCIELGQRKHPEDSCRIAEYFEREKESLRAITEPFDGYVEEMVRVSTTCLVRVDRNQYSVPAKFAGKAVSVRRRAHSILMVADNTVIASHQRSFGRDQVIFDPWHYLPILEKKPGALRNGRPFQEWDLPHSIVQVKEHLLKQPHGDKAFVDLLIQAGTQGIEALDVVCQLAIEQKVITGPIILNELRRLTSPPKPDDIPISEEWKLKINPIADCTRYDHLRENFNVCH